MFDDEIVSVDVNGTLISGDAPTYTVTASLGIQVFAESSWQDVAGQDIVLLQGTEYTFRATPAPWPSGSTDPQWTGITTHTGESVDVTFASTGTYSLTVAGLSGSETVDIQVVPLQVYSLEGTDSGSADNHEIRNSNGIKLFSGWINGSVQAGLCFTQGMKTAVHMRFTASEELSYETEVKIKGDVDTNDQYITGADYEETTITLGTTWPTPEPGHLFESTSELEPEVEYDTDAGIEWQWQAVGGNSSWFDAGQTNNLRYYITFAEPIFGDVEGTSRGVLNPSTGETVTDTGNFWFGHFTEANIYYVCKAARWHGPVSEHEVAKEVLEYHGSSNVVRSDEAISDVEAMWSRYRTSDGHCGQFAAGLAYMLRCLGIEGKVCFNNLNPALQTAPSNSGRGRDIGAGPSSAPVWYMGAIRISSIGPIHSDIWNDWQGAVFINADGADTVCYDAQHGDINTSWELGNDVDRGTSGLGVLYDYQWRRTSDGGSDTDQMDDDTAAPIGTVIPDDDGVPNEDGN